MSANDFDSDSSSDTINPSEALKSLNTSLDELEAVLQPLLSGSTKWEDILNEADELGKAKLGVVMAFGICDLVFVYLRMKGQDPKDHPVMKELQRIMQYNAKIKEAETGPAKARMKLDSAAASRFIIAAIPKSQRIPPPGSSTQTPIPPSAQAGPGPSSAAYVPPVGKMTRFRTFEGGEVDMSGGGEEAGEEDGEGNVGFEAGEDEDEDEDMEVETAPTKPVNKHLKFALSDDESSRSKSRSPSPSATTSTLPTSPSKLKRTSSAVIEPEVSGSGAGKGNKKRKVDKGEIGGKGKGGKAKGKEGAGKGVKGKKGKEKKKAF